MRRTVHLSPLTGWPPLREFSPGMHGAKDSAQGPSRIVAKQPLCRRGTGGVEQGGHRRDGALATAEGRDPPRESRQSGELVRILLVRGNSVEHLALSVEVQTRSDSYRF